MLVKVGPAVQPKPKAFAGAYSCKVLSIDDEAVQVCCRDPLNQRVPTTFPLNFANNSCGSGVA